MKKDVIGQLIRNRELQDHQWPNKGIPPVKIHWNHYWWPIIGYSTAYFKPLLLKFLKFAFKSMGTKGLTMEFLMPNA